MKKKNLISVLTGFVLMAVLFSSTVLAQEEPKQEKNQIKNQVKSELKVENSKQRTQ